MTKPTLLRPHRKCHSTDRHVYCVYSFRKVETAEVGGTQKLDIDGWMRLQTCVWLQNICYLTNLEQVWKLH